MGPPRRRGGRSKIWCPPRCPPLALQWGHLVVEVEGDGYTGCLPVRTGGFNGATSSSRWKVECEGKATPTAALASMGPPRRRGGRSSASGRLRTGLSGFNGATSSSRWKGCTSSGQAAPPQRASMGPPRRRGGRLFASVCWWWWEAGFNGATSSSRWKVVARIIMGLLATQLQWGHLVVEVEGRERSGPDPKPNPLQWGHLVVEVEGSSLVVVGSSRRSSFNGATSSSRWKAGRRRHSSGNQPRLQWDHLVVEVEGGVGLCQGDDTGPLQWGHLVVEEEGAPLCVAWTPSTTRFNGATSSSRWKGAWRRRPTTPALRRFNGATSSSRWKATVSLLSGLVDALLQWGHLVVEVEGVDCDHPVRRLDLASMGPPRRRGGRGGWKSRATGWLFRFNGATSSSRWKVEGVLVRDDDDVGASMGPPRRRGGRARGNCPSPPPRAQLQWGHLVVEVEG